MYRWACKRVIFLDIFKYFYKCLMNKEISFSFDIIFLKNSYTFILVLINLNDWKKSYYQQQVLMPSKSLNKLPKILFYFVLLILRLLIIMSAVFYIRCCFLSIAHVNLKFSFEQLVPLSSLELQFFYFLH